MNSFKMSVGSYNIIHGKFCNFEFDKLAEDIVSKDLDIVGLQEVDKDAIRSNNVDITAYLAEKTGLKYYQFFKAIPLKNGGEYGVAVISKYPILETERIELDSEGTGEQRVMGRVKVDVNGTMVNFFVAHLSYESSEKREVQFKQVSEIMNSYDNFILTGDFNTPDFSEYSVIENAKLINSDEKFVITFPLHNSCIDNIVYSEKTWSFDEPKRLVNKNSDHYMLYATGTYSGE